MSQSGLQLKNRKNIGHKRSATATASRCSEVGKLSVGHRDGRGSGEVPHPRREVIMLILPGRVFCCDNPTPPPPRKPEPSLPQKTGPTKVKIVRFFCDASETNRNIIASKITFERFELVKVAAKHLSATAPLGLAELLTSRKLSFKGFGSGCRTVGDLVTKWWWVRVPPGTLLSLSFQ